MSTVKTELPSIPISSWIHIFKTVRFFGTLFRSIFTTYLQIQLKHLVQIYALWESWWECFGSPLKALEWLDTFAITKVSTWLSNFATTQSDSTSMTICRECIKWERHQCSGVLSSIWGGMEKYLNQAQLSPPKLMYLTFWFQKFTSAIDCRIKLRRLKSLLVWVNLR